MSKPNVKYVMNSLESLAENMSVRDASDQHVMIVLLTKLKPILLTLKIAHVECVGAVTSNLRLCKSILKAIILKWVKILIWSGCGLNNSD